MSQSDKRRPTLADRYVHRRFAEHEKILRPSLIEATQRKVRDAHKFVLDEDAARRIADVVMAVPRLIVREQQFARAPFDLTWIEWPCHVYWKVLRDAHPDWSGEFSDYETADHTVGYLIDHDRVHTVAGGIVINPALPPDLTALVYRLHTEWPVDEQMEMLRLMGSGFSMDLDAVMWGSSWQALSDEERMMLRLYHAIEPAPVNPRHPNSHKMREAGGLEYAVRGCVGDLRTLLTILLMLNRPSIARYANAPASRGWVRNRVMPFLSHTTVTMSLDAVRVLRATAEPGGDGIARRWHPVRGHYCHNDEARQYARIAGCVHDWVQTDERWEPLAVPIPALDARHWVCGECGGHRWWRTYPQGRGDAGRGLVVRDGYDVTL